VKLAGRVLLAIGVLTTGVVSGLPVRSEDALAGTSGHVAEARSEIDRLGKIIESLNRRIETLDDALSALEARLADGERPAEPAAPLPMADCGAQEHGSVFVGKPVECYYGYRIHPCWNGEIKTVGGECEAARK
jgi:hypothetical protein